MCLIRLHISIWNLIVSDHCPLSTARQFSLPARNSCKYMYLVGRKTDTSTLGLNFFSFLMMSDVGAQNFCNKYYMFWWSVVWSIVCLSIYHVSALCNWLKWPCAYRLNKNDIPKLVVCVQHILCTTK